MKDKNRQLIITTIQKMSNAVNNSRYAAKTMDEVVSGDIRDRITISMPLLKKKALVNRIMAYMKSIVEKYSN